MIEKQTSAPPRVRRRRKPVDQVLPTSREIAEAAKVACDRPRQFGNVDDPYSFRKGFNEGACWLYDLVSPVAHTAQAIAAQERADLLQLVSEFEAGADGFEKQGWADLARRYRTGAKWMREISIRSRTK